LQSTEGAAYGGGDPLSIVTSCAQTGAAASRVPATMTVAASVVGLSQLRVDIIYSIDPIPLQLTKRYRSIYYPRADMAGTPNLEGCEDRCRYKQAVRSENALVQ
jgi:hypothetical protein